MKLAIIGRGSVARALGTALSAQEVVYGVRSPTGANESTIAEAAAAAEVILLATPFSAMVDVAAGLSDHVAGKPVIDATNPVGMTDHGLDLVTSGGPSAAERLQAALPASHVVKCFNQIGAEFMADPDRLSVRPVMFAAGDDPAARQTALALATEAGFEAVSAGPLSNARHLEHLAMLWIWSAMKGDLGRRFGFALSHLEP